MSCWRPAWSALTSCCGALLILFSCYENTTPLRWGGKECGMGERRGRIIWARGPQTSQTHSSPGRQPPGLLRCSDLCPGEPAGCPAGRPASHIWQPLGKASCRPSGEWQTLELTAGGSRWGGRSWTWEPAPGSFFLEDGGLLRASIALCPREGSSSARPGGPPTGLPGPHSFCFASRQLDSHRSCLARPQTAAHGRKGARLQTENNSWARAKLGGREGRGGESSCL